MQPWTVMLFLSSQLSSQQDCIVDHLTFQCCSGIMRLEHPHCPSEHAGASIWTMWRLCDVYIIFLPMFHFLVRQQVLFRGGNSRCGWDRRTRRVWSQRLIFLTLLSFACFQRNSSLSGSTRGIYQVSERHSSPSTGYVCTPSMCLQKVMCKPANTPAGWPVFEFFGWCYLCPIPLFSKQHFWKFGVGGWDLMLFSGCIWSCKNGDIHSDSYVEVKFRPQSTILFATGLLFLSSAPGETAVLRWQPVNYYLVSPPTWCKTLKSPNYTVVYSHNGGACFCNILSGKEPKERESGLIVRLKIPASPPFCVFSCEHLVPWKCFSVFFVCLKVML